MFIAAYGAVSQPHRNFAKSAKLDKSLKRNDPNQKKLDKSPKNTQDNSRISFLFDKQHLEMYNISSETLYEGASRKAIIFKKS